MRRTLFALPILAAISVALNAQQTPAANQQPAPGTATQTQATATAGAGQQNWSGVLLDASCSAITSERASTSTTTGVTSYSASTSKGATATTPGTPAQPGASASATIKANETNANDPLAPRTTTQASATATTAERSRTTTPDATPSATTARTTPGTATSQSTVAVGERSRTIGTPDLADSGAFTGSEKYKDCMIKPASSAFAIHSNGKLIILDEASNQMVREQLSGDQFKNSLSDANGNPKWTSVTLSGSIQGDRLKVTSVNK